MEGRRLTKQAKRNAFAEFWLTHFAVMPVHKHSCFGMMTCGVGWCGEFRLRNLIYTYQLPSDPWQKGFSFNNETLEQYLAA